MTISSIEVAFDLVNEMQGQGLTVGSVYEYTNSMTGQKLFAVFTADQHCDIHESSYVENPVRIWCQGNWLALYDYLNYM